MDDDAEESGIQGSYTDTNRAFLQALMSRGTITFTTAAPILAAIFSAQENEAVSPQQVTQEDLDSYLAAASAAISPFDLEIRSARDQRTKERTWAVVNTTSDNLAQIATLHGAEEIGFVKRCIDAMFEKYNTVRIEAMCLDSMQANKLRIPPPPAEDETGVQEEEMVDEDGNLVTTTTTTTSARPQASQLKGLKSSEAEAVMISMVDEGWFDKTREGFYMLSTRALLELRTWLVDAYNEPETKENKKEWKRVKHCRACREIVTVGKRCPERDCNVRLHEICEDAFWRAQRRGGGGGGAGEKKCPSCKTVWGNKQHYVGPKAITETEAYQRGRRRSNKGRSSNLTDQIMEDDGEDGEEEEGNPEQGVVGARETEQSSLEEMEDANEDDVDEAEEEEEEE